MRSPSYLKQEEKAIQPHKDVSLRSALEGVNEELRVFSGFLTVYDFYFLKCLSDEKR